MTSTLVSITGVYVEISYKDKHSSLLWRHVVHVLIYSPCKICGSEFEHVHIDPVVITIGDALYINIKLMLTFSSWIAPFVNRGIGVTFRSVGDTKYGLGAFIINFDLQFNHMPYGTRQVL